jgi:hypothetical protein
MYGSRQKESQRMPIRLDASVLLTAGPPIDSDQGMLIYVLPRTKNGIRLA